VLADIISPAPTAGTRLHLCALELYAEDAGIEAGGARVVRFPFLNPGARVEIEGLDGNGGRRSETVVVGASGSTTFRWDR
jgi:hypothetical protein